MPYPAPPRLVLPSDLTVPGAVLRPPSAEDVDALTEILQDADIQRLTRVPSPYTRADAMAFLKLSAEALRASSGLHLLICDNASQRPLGMVGLTMDWRDAVAEIGYYLAAEGRDRGLVTAACRRIIQIGFDHGLKAIHLQAAVGNPASYRIADRLGFTRVGRLRQTGIDGPAGDLTASRTDMWLYDLLPGELTSP